MNSGSGYQTEDLNTVIGILAHVDAGKTTLSEGILYETGVLRKTGRVDHGDTAMDTHELEKERGITIFSSQAEFTACGRRFTLLDTPGHVDFSSEMERTLAVLDAAILVLSGTDGVQAHTRTLWRLLSLYGIPTFIFVTKMDYARYPAEEIMTRITSEFGDECVNFCADPETVCDQIAMCDEDAMQTFLEEGTLSKEQIRRLISDRTIFPVYFGSGLRGDGIREFLEGLAAYTRPVQAAQSFGAKVFKITHDASGNKITHLKVTGGVLNVKDLLGSAENGEKVNQLRFYTGEKYRTADQALPGDIAAVLGTQNLKSGDEIGAGRTYSEPVLEPVMRYTVELPEGTDPMTVLPLLRKLEEEDPMLKLSWNGFLQEIQVGLMGEVQAEILKSLIAERFGLSVEITKGHVLYKETITKPVEGVGHYEPLRHYAETHLYMEPLPRGSGIVIASACSEEVLDRNFQRLILTHLLEKEHVGVLTGSPITDIRITLVSGRSHLKHTEGGDFRQATYRALRQGLMSTESRLLEPYFRFRLELPAEVMSRAINDIRQMGGSFAPPVYDGIRSFLIGRAPVSEMNDYAKEVASYSGGSGKLVLESDGYDFCHNEAEMIQAARYVPEADLENSPDSIFCAHGAGFLVKWDKVPEYMHIGYWHPKQEVQAKPKVTHTDVHVSDKELEEIMLREFGPIRRAQYGARRAPNRAETERAEVPAERNEVLIVDGYNVIFAWEELRELASQDIQAARDRLMHILTNYSAYTRCETVLVFDGYRVPGNKGERFDFENIHVVFTKESESGDLFIERLIQKIGRNDHVRVVTSDGMIQLSVLRKGVVRVSSAEFERLVDEANEAIAELIEKNRKLGKSTLKEVLEGTEVPSDNEEEDTK